MIKDAEVRQAAGRESVPQTTIERDHAQNWLLGSIDCGSLIFKGGTCIRKIFIEDYRFSDDLDFTLTEHMDQKEIKNIFRNAAERASNDSGIDFHEDVSMKTNRNGFEGRIYFTTLRPHTHPMRIKLDITTRDREKILLPVQTKPIIHPYTDVLDRNIASYALEEIFAEKIRALFQRTRPRDLYDVWSVSAHIDKNTVEKILPYKFEVVSLKPDLDMLDKRKRIYTMSWDSSLGHQMRTVPDSDRVFQEGKDILSRFIYT